MKIAKELEKSIFIRGSKPVEVGDMWFGYCCEGFNFEITMILISMWGVCHNQFCPRANPLHPVWSKLMEDYWHEMGSVEPKDFEEWLAGKNVA